MPNTKLLYSKDIIKAIQAGNTALPEELYSTCREDFFQWAKRRFHGTPLDFEDAWQESVIALYESVTSGKLTELRHSVRTWLFAVGYKRLLNQNRKTKRILWKDQVDETLVKDTQLFDFQWDEPPKDELALVEKAMQSISPQCRELLAMRFYQGKKIPAIMVAMGHSSENTTSASLSRCLKKLREIVTASVDIEYKFKNGD